MGLRPLPAGDEARDRRRGRSRCLLLAVGARDKSVGENWGGYTVDEAAAKHGASVDEDTTRPPEAYAKVAKRKPTRTGDDWLPD